MSLTLNKSVTFPIGDLSVVRIRCRRGKAESGQCDGVAEILADVLSGQGYPPTCPACGQPFSVPNVGNLPGLRALGMVLTALTSATKCEPGFSLPVD